MGRSRSRTSPIEYQEATAFLAQARSIYEQLRPFIAAADPAAAERLGELLGEIHAIMRDLGDSARVQAAVAEGLSLVQSALQMDVSTGDVAAIFTIVDTLLDEVLSAAEAGRYADAERTRIEAYGLFESGPELRLANRASLLSREIERLFWEGGGGQPGLYTLLDRQAAVETIASAITIMRSKLDEAETFLGARLTTPAAALNSAIIILREGLEAVLIIGAILAYMVKTGAPRRFIRWVAAGVIGALALSAAIWFASETFLTITPAQRELIEEITSLIAVAVLFYVTKWLFHKVYVVDWMKFMREQADKALNDGRAFGLAAQGFTVVYREGFETMLLLQALVLDAGVLIVLQSVALGLIGVGIVGFITFRLQTRLPYMHMMVVTGILIGVVPVMLVGSTVRMMQVIAWLPVHPIEGVQFPHWWGQWFGVYPTWEGILAQIGTAAFVIVSYYLAEYRAARARRKKQTHSS